jgi:hypothetical protein
MAPGTYLEKRRVMAGYSIAGLARELLTVSSFGAAQSASDFHRLQLTLLAAEDGSLHHSPERIDLIRNFVRLDPSVYFRLIDLDFQMPGLKVHGVCRVCACTFHDPCSVPVDPAAGLGASTCCWVEANLCSACADATRNQSTCAPPASPVARQLRDLGERIRRFDNDKPGPLTEAMLTPAPGAGGPPMTGAMLRLVPKEEDNHG